MYEISPLGTLSSFSTGLSGFNPTHPSRTTKIDLPEGAQPNNGTNLVYNATILTDAKNYDFAVKSVLMGMHSPHIDVEYIKMPTEYVSIEQLS